MMAAGILELLSSAGQRYTRKSGREYAGPCPLCGGADRCSVWPERDRWWCRQCGKGGDAVDLLRLRDGMTYHDACAALGIQPAHQVKALSPAGRRVASFGKRCTSVATPKCNASATPSLPPSAWMEKAVAFLESCRTEAALSCRAAAVLYDRGFTPDGVRALGIGFNPSTRWVPKAAWGIEGEGNLCLPAGIVLPVWRKAGLVALEVRRFGKDAEQWGKYAFIQGGASGLSHVHGAPDSCGAWLVVEGALDGFLALQDGKPHVAGFVACAGISKGISADALAFLKERPAVAIVPDSDKPGASGCERLQADLPGAVIVDVPVGKDLTEMHASGVPLSAWAEAFLPAPPSAAPSHPWPVLHELNERYQVGALPAEDGSGLVLYPAAGLLLSEKLAALRYAQDNLEALLHDLVLEHLPRRVWLDGDKEKGDGQCHPRRNASNAKGTRQERSKREAWKERTEQQAVGTMCGRHFMEEWQCA